MRPPDQPPADPNLDQWETYALAYLCEQLREAAPKALSKAVLFPHSPLEGEGAVVAYEFTSKRAGPEEQRYFVVVGKTEPNYYPAHNLPVEDAFDLHLGTRFMLVMGVARVDEADAPREVEAAYDPVADARSIVDRVAPDAPIEEVTVAATFDVGGELHAVLGARVAGEQVYIMARDAPPGFSRRVDLPVQVVYRLHIGHVLRTEPTPGEDD